jgi:DNA-binding transcriptional regulator YiaG
MVSDEVNDVIQDDAEVDVAEMPGEIGLDSELVEGSGKVSEIEQMCAQYLSTRNSSRFFIDRFSRAMFVDERVRKICRVRALKSGADLRDVEEVLQRVMIVFFGSQLQKMREANAIYAVIYSIASNVSREVVRDSQVLTYNHDSIEDMRDRGLELEQVGLVESTEQDRDQLIDSKIAAAKLARAFTMLQNGETKLTKHGVFNADYDPLIEQVPPSTESLDAPIDVAPSNKGMPRARRAATPNRETKLSDDQRELVEIIEGLGIHNQDFAAALGIGLPRLSSYIYGRTASVPDTVMQMARELRDEDPQAKAKRDRFKKPMSQILNQWQKQLEVDNDPELAQCLGVTKMTIFRWRNDQTKPDQTALVRYEQMVHRFAERMKEIREQATARA